MATEESKSKDIILRFKARRCIHSRHCVLSLPGVFQANVDGPWLHPENATSDDIASVAQNCPSGAIQYERLDGAENEKAPKVNTVKIRENGPLAFHAELKIHGYPDSYRATLCRCGQSRLKPYCDSSHHEAGFVATGEPASKQSTSLEVRNGPLQITPSLNGPLIVSGNLEICSGTGRTIAKTQKTALCRCGKSATKPFCDGTHDRVGFSDVDRDDGRD